MIDSTLINRYAKRNTSPKMPIEEKYVNAFMSALLNSTSVDLMYNRLKESVWNEEKFIGLLSYWDDCGLFTDMNSPYRSLIAFSMLKKNDELFEAVSQAFFTGTFHKYRGSGKSDEVIEFTDTNSTISKDVYHTDEFGLTTDMSPGLYRLSFKNYYYNDDDSCKSGKVPSFVNVQPRKDFEKSLEDFYKFITIVKPARVGLQTYNVPVCGFYLNEKKDTTTGTGWVKGWQGMVTTRADFVLTNISNPNKIENYYQYGEFYCNGISLQLEPSETSLPNPYTKYTYDTHGKVSYYDIYYELQYNPDMIVDGNLNIEVKYKNAQGGELNLKFTIPEIIPGIGSPYMFQFMVRGYRV